MTDRPLEQGIRTALALLERCGLRGAFGGGLAVVIWGQPRVTQDLDLFVQITPEQVASLLAEARALGLRADEDEQTSARELLEGGFLRLHPPAGHAPIALDLLRADGPLHLEALRRARPFQLGDLSVPVLAPEDLILLKLVSFRPKDTFDLEVVVQTSRHALDLDYLRAWADRIGLRTRLEAFIAPGPTDEEGPAKGRSSC